MRHLSKTYRLLLLSAALTLLPKLADAGSNQSRVGPLGMEVAQLGDLFNPTLRELRSLVDRQQFADAGRYYLANSSALDASSSDVQALVRAIADGLNESARGELQAARAALDAWPRSSLPNTSDWRRMRADLEGARRVLAEHKARPIVSEPRFQSQQYVQLALSLSILESNLREVSWRAFSEFEHSKGSFFNEYPLIIDRRSFLHDQTTQLTDLVQVVDRQTAGALYRSYGEALPSTVKQAIVQAALHTPSATGEQPKPYWEKLSVAASSGVTLRTPAEVGARVMLLPTAGVSRLEVSSAERLAEGSLVAAAVERDSDYSVLVVESPGAVDRKITDRKSVQSRYVSGETQVPNPAHTSAQAAFISAQSNLNSIRTSNALNPPVNFAVAILQAAAVGAAAARVNEAQQALAVTPPTLTEKVYSPYSFEVVTVTAERLLEYEVVLVDRPTQSAKRIPRSHKASKTFQLAYGLRPDDPDVYSHRRTFQTEPDLTAWEGVREPVELSLPDLLAESSTLPSVSLAQLGAIQAKPAAGAPPAVQSAVASTNALIQDDPRFASIVVLRSPTGSLGTGFYVGEFLILTNYHVVEGARIVEVKLRDGRDGVGQVERFDIGADLALVRVTQRGSPVKFSVSQLVAGETVEAIGHPRNFEYSITRGVVSAVRRMRNLAVPASNELAVIQTDTPINPGNSGGPLYRGAEVIGVNTHKLRGTEGMGFAVHASEVQRFLER
jgi:serine protease Do